MQPLLQKFKTSNLKTQLDPEQVKELDIYFDELMKGTLSKSHLVDFYTIVRLNINKFKDVDYILRPFEEALRNGLESLNSKNDWAVNKIFSSFN